MPSLTDAVHELYACAPSEFVARRTALAGAARASGQRDVAAQITALRKPTAAAALVNQLDPESMDAVLALGQELRAAQTRLDSDAMKDATARRQHLLHDVVTQLEARGQVAEEVRATLLAATADRAAAEAVASRALVRPLRYSGWGDVDLGDAVAHQAAMELQGGSAALGTAESEGRGTMADGRTPGGTTSDGRTHGGRTPGDAGSAAEQRRRPGRPALRLVAEPTPAELDAARSTAHAEISAEIARLETRVRAAQAAIDSATAARDSAASALEKARARLSDLT